MKKGLRNGGVPNKVGRPPGRLNNRTIALAHRLDKLVPDRWLLGVLKRLADKGDSRAAIYLADRKWGKPPQTIEHSGDVPIRLVVELPIDYSGK